MKNETPLFTVCPNGKLTVNQYNDLELVGFKDIVFGTVFIMKDKNQ